MKKLGPSSASLLFQIQEQLHSLRSASIQEICANAYDSRAHDLLKKLENIHLIKEHKDYLEALKMICQTEEKNLKNLKEYLLKNNPEIRDKLNSQFLEIEKLETEEKNIDSENYFEVRSHLKETDLVIFDRYVDTVKELRDAKAKIQKQT